MDRLLHFDLWQIICRQMIFEGSEKNIFSEPLIIVLGEVERIGKR